MIHVLSAASMTTIWRAGRCDNVVPGQLVSSITYGAGGDASRLKRDGDTMGRFRGAFLSPCIRVELEGCSG